MITSGIAGEGWREIADLTWPTMDEYARKHGLAFAPKVIPAGFSRPPSWAKLIAIAECFAEADEVLWLDADVAVVDATVNLFDVVPEGPHQAMAHRIAWGGDPEHWNAGVWLLRKPCIPLLLHAAMRDHCVSHKWWEQQAINEIIEEYGVPTHNLPEEWNACRGFENPRFFHACGIPLSGKADALSQL